MKLKKAFRNVDKWQYGIMVKTWEEKEVEINYMWQLKKNRMMRKIKRND